MGETIQRLVIMRNKGALPTQFQLMRPLLQVSDARWGGSEGRGGRKEVNGGKEESEGREKEF